MTIIYNICIIFYSESMIPAPYADMARFYAKQSRVREHHAMARRFTMEMNKVKVPLVLVKNIGDHLLFAVVHQVVAWLPSNRKVSSR